MIQDAQTSELVPRVREIVAIIFGVPFEDVTPATSSDTIERWDSLGRLVLTIELEQSFGVALTPEDTQKLTSVGAIVEWLSANGGGEARTETGWG